MKKFSKITEANSEKEYIVKATIELTIKAENEGEVGYQADDILSSVEKVSNYEIINIDSKNIGIKENKELINVDKWRRLFNKKPIFSYIFQVEDPMGNEYRYMVHLKYEETLKGDSLYFKGSLISGTEGSGASNSISNMQNKPSKFFDVEDKVIYKDSKLFDETFINTKSLEKEINKLTLDWFLETIPDLIEKWINSGVYKINTHTTKKYF